MKNLTNNELIEMGAEKVALYFQEHYNDCYSLNDMRRMAVPAFDVLLERAANWIACAKEVV